MTRPWIGYILYLLATSVCLNAYLVDLTDEGAVLKMNGENSGYITCGPYKYNILEPNQYFACPTCGSSVKAYECEDDNKCNLVSLSASCNNIEKNNDMTLCVYIDKIITCYSLENADQSKKSDVQIKQKAGKRLGIKPIEYFSLVFHQNFTKNIEEIKRLYRNFISTLQLRQYTYIFLKLTTELYKHFITVAKNIGDVDSIYYDEYPFKDVLVNDFVDNFYRIYYFYKNMNINIPDSSNQTNSLMISFFWAIYNLYSIHGFSSNLENVYGNEYRLEMDKCPVNIKAIDTSKVSAKFKNIEGYCSYLNDMLGMNNTNICRDIYLSNFNICKHSLLSYRILSIYGNDSYCSSNKGVSNIFPCKKPESENDMKTWIANANYLVAHINVEYEFPSFFFDRLKTLIAEPTFKEYMECNFDNILSSFTSLLGRIIVDSVNSMSFQSSLKFNNSMEIYDMYVKYHGNNNAMLSYTIYKQMMDLILTSAAKLSRPKFSQLALRMESIIENSSNLDRNIYNQLCGICKLNFQLLLKYNNQTKCGKCGN